MAEAHANLASAYKDRCMIKKIIIIIKKGDKAFTLIA